MENPTPSQKTHPLVILAAVTVILTCLVAIAWFAGFLPVKSSPPSEPQAQTNVAPEVAAPSAAAKTQKQSRPAADVDVPIVRMPHRVVRQVPQREPEYAQRSYGASAPMYERDEYGSASRQPYAQAPATCRDCATVENVREVKQEGQGSGLGAIGGGVLGGVLGNQIGGGHGKTVGAVVGAVGGAYAGNEVEKSARSSKYYEITLRFDDGNTRAFTQAQRPDLQRGDRVRVSGGQLIRL